MRCLLLVVMMLVVTRTASAHDPGLSRGEYRVVGAGVEATLIFAARDVAYAGGPGVIGERVVVRGDGAPCPSRITDSASVETDGVRIVVHAACASPPREVAIDAEFLALLPFAHRHLARTGNVERALTVSRRSFSLAAAPAPRASLLVMGIEHILTGYDHLVFLVGLVVVATRARTLAWIVTAFTLGHSLSLALATLGVFSPSARVVEPLIALSIVYVGVENIVRPRATARWLLTLPFGFVHGLGFAGALRELSLPRAEVPRALLLFNVGVEVGQLAVLAVLLPIVVRLHRAEWFRVRGVRVVSASVAALGVVWFALRLTE